METILLLEDEESLNRGIAFSLEKRGFSVIPCTSVAEAKLGFLNGAPSLCICDLTLPDGDGLSFIRWMREKGSGAYIICLTALDGEVDQVMGYEAGADDYVTKPFSLSVLMLKVEAYARRAKREAAKEQGEVLISGGVRLESARLKAYRNGEELALTQKEWKLLLAFLTHPRQILSKAQLLSQLFDGEGGYAAENAVAVNICRLRDKLEADSSRPEYIKNIRGLGYLWDQECRRI